MSVNSDHSISRSKSVFEVAFAVTFGAMKSLGQPRRPWNPWNFRILSVFLMTSNLNATGVLPQAYYPKYPTGDWVLCSDKRCVVLVGQCLGLDNAHRWMMPR